MNKKNLVGLALAAIGLVLITDCSKTSTPDGTATIAPTLTSLYQNVLSQNCVTCHQPGGASNGATLDFTSISTAYSTLLSAHVNGASSTSTCGSVSIVTPNHPETSYLEAVIDPSYTHGNFVVAGCTPYHNHIEQGWMTSAELTAFSSWISSGAGNN